MAAAVTHRSSAVWVLSPLSPQARVLSGQSGLSLPLAQVLINRGIRDENGLRSFLSPRLSSLLDPMLLKDMDRAVSMVIEAIVGREPIIIYGDYDADGLTATALLVKLLTRFGASVSYYIPNRLTEGYGLNESAVRHLAGRSNGLLITVDCGISNQEEIALLHGLGMKVIITDHHQVPEGFEPKCPVINPHRRDCPFSFKMLSGVGVAFFLAIALRSALRERGWFRSRSEPDLRDYLDLVALGTVADMVPLQDQNRILVNAGLERLAKSSWPGMKALRDISDLPSQSHSRADDLSFRLAPRLNACGRMGDAETGIRALITDSPVEAKRLSEVLNGLNIRRQGIESGILEQIEKKIPSVDFEDQVTLVFAGKGWHRGVLGIVASKLVEKYSRPAVVLDLRENMAVGSARSIPGFDLYGALSRLKPLLTRFGGHTHAAGLSLDISCLPDFARGLETVARERLGPRDLFPTIEVDAQVDLCDMDIRTIEGLSSFGPFGSGNPEPVFYTPSLEILGARQVGGKHLRLRLRKGGIVLEAIGFNLAGRILPGCSEIHAVYTPEINHWQGRKRVELRILDFVEAGGDSKLRKKDPGKTEGLR